MTRLLAVFVCLLAVAPGAVGATAAPPADCSGVQNTTAVVTDAAGDRVTGTVRLYPGSELTLTVCSGGDSEDFGPVWGLADSPVYERVGNTSESVRLRVVDAGAGERVSLGEAIQRRSARGPTVVVPPANTVTWNATDGASVTLRFETADQRKAFAAASDRHSTARQELNDTLSALPTNASAGDESAPNASQVVTALREYERTSVALQQAAFPATATGDAAAADTVTRRSSERLAAARDRVRERLTAYESALVEERSGIVGTSRLAFGGALAGGVLVGAAVGVWFAGRRRAEIDFDQTYDSGTTLDPRHVAVPLAAGGLLLVGGLAAAVVLGVVGVIV